jgi:hypothetical protein
MIWATRAKHVQVRSGIAGLHLPSNYGKIDD